MKTESMIRANIMSRVYRLYFIREVSAPTVRAIIFLAVIVAVTPLVSVPNVIANMAKVSFSGIAPFFASAFLETEFFVQGAAIIALFILFWSLVDVVKRVGRTPAHA